MRQILRTTGVLLAHHWASVAAVLLVAWTLHHYGLEFAAIVAVSRPAIGWALIPLAILLFIAGYALVFRILRGDLPSFEAEAPARQPVVAPPRSGRERLTDRSRRYARSFSTLASAVVLPFFIMWSAWGFFDEDMSFFSSEVLRRFVFTDNGPDFRPDEVPIGWISITILVIAYAARIVSERFERRVPVLSIATVYFEVLWVFFLAVVVFTPLRGLVAWVGDTALWADISDWWYAILEAVEPLRAAWEAVVTPLAGIVPPILEAFVLAIAWFALVGIVLGRPLSQPSASRAFLARHPRFEHFLRRSSDEWGRTPGVVREALRELGEDLLIRLSSLWSALRALRALGADRIAFFILAWVTLTAAEVGLTIVMREVLGPQTLAFWMQLFNPLLIIPWILPQVAKMCLLAATYDAAIAAGTGATVRPEFRSQPGASLAGGAPAG